MRSKMFLIVALVLVQVASLLVCVQAKEIYLNLKKDSLDVWVDCASFYYQSDPEESYLEIYYSLNRKQLEFVPQKEGYLSGIVINMQIRDKRDSIVEDRMWRIGSMVESVEEASQKDYFTLDVISTVLPPGKYTLRLEAQDVISEKKGSTTKEIIVKDYSESGLKLSDMEMAYRAEQSYEAGKFTKGGMKMPLNAIGFFNADEMMMYFYAEIYGLGTSSPDSSKYKLNFAVFDTNGIMVKDFGEQTREGTGKIGLVMSGINISTLPVGDYLFKVSIEDLKNKSKAEETKEFFVFKGGPAIESISNEAILTEEQAKQARNEIVYIAAPSELKLYDELSLTGKTEFLKKFWDDRDPIPETPENEFKIEHYRRWNYVNENFSRTTTSKDGWHTDMGRVYIKYGQPDEIERHPSSMNFPAYEEWNYSKLQGGVYFIFVELKAEAYTLVHSTARNEIQDSKWLEKLGKEGFSL